MFQFVHHGLRLNVKFYSQQGGHGCPPKFVDRFARHGRTAGCPAAPAQIPACGTIAPGSSRILTSA